MKKILIIFICLVVTALLGADDIEYENMIRDHASFSIPVDKEHVSVNPGFVYSNANPGFPIIAVSIPFAGNYYLTGEVGAGIDQYEPGNLSLFAAGFGLYNHVENFDDLYFDLALSYRNRRSLTYSTDILSLGFMIEQSIRNIYLGIGMELKVQDYEIIDSQVFPDINDRVTRFIVNVCMRSPLGNIAVKGTPEQITAGVSWTLTLDK